MATQHDRDVVVVTGLADPCVEIGTEHRYELLVMPWSHLDFKQTITRMIKADRDIQGVEELNPVDSPTGLRFWLCRFSESLVLNELHDMVIRQRWDERLAGKVAQLVDDIVKLPACHEIECSGADKIMMAELENTLLHHLK